MDDIIKSLIVRSLDKENEPTLSRKDSVEMMESFKRGRQETDIKVGDYVERNRFGKQKYKSPRGNQVAVCLEKYENFIQDEQHMPCNMLIAVTYDQDHVSTFLVDSAYYCKADENKNVFSLKFGKKKE